ncbi:DUF4156 domain-containing protein [Chitinimonas sp. BJB300]|uniref:DUF4156 domain-containing protein n=1 Tax=Chitinimonas sp. BJB300 TaxID=1559339 RepID=UPI000C1070CB|nr:DUF4156 domain-containing protein [Chitinimonas sp. BJB300]PHV12912.1 hypothetical protein CSQ89_03220 [Chitinimonas sp. BJB300]
MMRKSAAQCKSLLGLLLVVSLGACAPFVPLKSAAEAVEVSNLEATTACTLKGNVRVKVLNKLGPVARDPGKVIIELNTLARNSAVEQGGDTVAAAGPIADGEREYKVFRCH